MAGILSFLQDRGRPHGGPIAEAVHTLDAAVEERIESRRSPSADRVFYGLSSAADHGLLWLAIGAVRAAVVPRHRRSFVRLAIAMGAESALTNGVIKTAFRRVRPPEYYDDAPLPFGMHRPITSAFPSGHAASAFTAATLLAEDDPLAPAYYGLAALVAASRVYVKMHHASDVVAGTAWGLALGRLVRRRFPVR
ncbi:MAG: phosphatase PAP2 family protein [Actinobacteria bacterium]|nr:phosphatase PAP2 family protein [Actinomycetota bacterium]